MTYSFPLPGAPALDMPETKRVHLPVRGLAQLMSRRMVLANLTDQPISLAQFNCLMAEHAPYDIKQACLMHNAAEAVCDPLAALVGHDGGMELADALPRVPDFAHLLPQNYAAALRELNKIVPATINSLAQQLSQFGNPHAPLLPIKRKVKPLPPEDAAWQWAEAMEELLTQPAAVKAG